MRITIKNSSLLIIAITMTVGCAQQIEPQTKRAALMGAGTGAVVTAVTGSNIVTGTLVGAAVGGGLQHLQR